MIYDIRVDIIEPATGIVLAKKGDRVETLAEQIELDIAIDEFNAQHGPFYYRRTYPRGERVIIEPIKPGHVAAAFGFSHWTDIYLDLDAPVLHFLVSEDEEHWHPMTRASDPIEDAFTYDIDLETVYQGDLFEVTDAYREDLA